MVRFNWVKWRNVLSTGQMPTLIQLDRSPSTLVTGKNGGGKSTMLDAITFGLFGKPFRKINKGQLVNTKNGRDLLVEIQFQIGPTVFEIKRGIKPDIFEVYKDGVLQNQPGDSRDYQRFLNGIIGFDYQTFVQIVIVGKTQYTPFMKLDSAKRRQFVETLLNLLVFSNMNKIHTVNLNAHKEKLTELKAAIQVAQEKVNIRRRYINDLEKDAAKAEESSRIQLQERIAALEASRLELTDQRDAIQKSEPITTGNQSQLTTKVQSLMEVVTKLNVKIDEMRIRIEYLQKNDTCQACGQPIAEELKQSKCQELESKIAECIQVRDQLEQTRNERQLELDTLKRQLLEHDKWSSQVRSLNDKIAFMNEQIRLLTQEGNQSKVDNQAKIAEETKRLLELQDVYEKLLEKRAEMADRTEYLNAVSTMLKDGGIKSMLIRKYISIINHAINANLAKLGFFAKFTLSENFEETIQARGIDTLSYDNFSEGEKLRIDMAILLAWREIAKLQNNVSTNLLIFDEIFDASLDQYGIDALSMLLNELRDTNIFIVSHSPDKLADKVRSQIQFHKVEGFSKMVT